MKKVSGVSTGHHAVPKFKHDKAIKAPKMPKQPKEIVPKMARITPGHGIAGTSTTHHQAQVVKALHQPRVRQPQRRSSAGMATNPAPSARALGPKTNIIPQPIGGIPVGNPAPGPTNAFE